MSTRRTASLAWDGCRMAAPEKPGADRYRTTLADLERAVRVPFEAQVESQSTDLPPGPGSDWDEDRVQLRLAGGL